MVTQRPIRETAAAEPAWTWTETWPRGVVQARTRQLVIDAIAALTGAHHAGKDGCETCRQIAIANLRRAVEVLGGAVR